MRLELGQFRVHQVVLQSTGPAVLDHGRLTVGLDQAMAVLSSEAGLRNVRLELAAPGESARIIHVLDAVEPRVKVSENGSLFPGFAGPPKGAGTGRTFALSGVATLTTGILPGAQEAIVDMSGPGADISPLARTWNLVLQAEPASGVSDLEYDATLRRANLKLATYLAGAAVDQTPDETVVCELPPVDPQLPRVGYVCFLQAQGDFRDTFLYGSTARHLVPTLLHPAELWDGAVVSGNYVIGCQKNPTYLHQRNPVVAELLRRHGQDLAFAGIIVANEHNTLVHKLMTAGFNAKLAQLLGIEALIISQEGGGHADSDLMLTCQACEQAGIKTVLLANELAGTNGDLPSLVDVAPEADAIISTGNNDQFVELPGAERVLGGTAIQGFPGPAGQPLRTQLGILYCATNQLGANRLTTVTY